jgi:predicted lipoprotein with Yx(FWY)xxD motif
MRQFTSLIASISVVVMMASTAVPARAASKEVASVEAMIASVETPAGVGKRVTYLGPVFTDKGGMTLYQFAHNWQCNNKRMSVKADAHQLFKLYEKSPAPLCSDQWPALMASEKDRPVGDWTIKTWPDGTKQWAYKGRPVHRSYRDQFPGDVNGPTLGEGGVSYDESGTTIFIWKFSVAAVPMTLPPGVRVKNLRPFGFVAVSKLGALYTLDAPVKRSRSVSSNAQSAIKTISTGCADCSEHDRFKPFSAGAMAGSLGPWTVITLKDGSKAWAFEGKPVYTYKFDSEAAHTKGLGVEDKVQLVTLVSMPMAPPGITVQNTVLGPVYADSRGMTTYRFYCANPIPGETFYKEVPGFWCDGFDVDPTYREGFCAAPEKCGERWQPVQAPANAEPRPGLWSIAVIPDKRYALRWVPAKVGEKLSPEAMKVWMYQGRPIFTVAWDEQPGDMWGHDVQVDQNPVWQALRAGEAEERGIAAGN